MPKYCYDIPTFFTLGFLYPVTLSIIDPSRFLVGRTIPDSMPDASTLSIFDLLNLEFLTCSSLCSYIAI